MGGRTMLIHVDIKTRHVKVKVHSVRDNKMMIGIRGRLDSKAISELEEIGGNAQREETGKD